MDSAAAHHRPQRLSVPDWPQLASNESRRRAARETCAPIGRAAPSVRQHGRRLAEPTEKAGPGREGGGGWRRGAARTERPRESSAAAAMEDGVYGTAVRSFTGGEGRSSAAIWGWGKGGGGWGNAVCHVTAPRLHLGRGSGHVTGPRQSVLGEGGGEATPPWLTDHAPSRGVNGKGGGATAVGGA